MRRDLVLAAVDLTDDSAARAVVREVAVEAEMRQRPKEAVAVVPEAFAGSDWRYAIRGKRGMETGAEFRALAGQTLEGRFSAVVQSTST
jgi:hypothetical protein